MTREEVYNSCLQKISNGNTLLLEAATGLGKSKIAIDLINHIVAEKYQDKPTSMLLLVAKNVHKETWKEEFAKWGGLNVDNIVIECYESLRKHEGEAFTFILMDEVHHVNSDIRLQLLLTLRYNYIIGLSATIPKKLKQWFKWKYKSQIVSCDLIEAIEDDVLPEPEIVLFPLQIDNTHYTETIEINPKAKGKVYYGEYKDYWKFKKAKVHAILSCTQRQKLNEINSLITWQKNMYMRKRNKGMEMLWLSSCGHRLEYLSDCKVNIVKDILMKLKNYRTITFCKTINQSELLGKNCIHSQNKDSDDTYNKFNQKKIKHITAVNILNENANLVDCKYAIFTNLSSSDIVIPQRLGRAMRHKHPVIIVPYYAGTREAEIVEKMFKGYNQDFIRTINSIEEI